MSVCKMEVESTVTGSVVTCCKYLILTSVLAILLKMKGCFNTLTRLSAIGCNHLKINT